MGRQEHQPGHDPLAEAINEPGVTEVGVNLPVRGHGAQVHDPNMADRGLRGEVLDMDHPATLTGSLRSAPGGYPPTPREPSVTLAVASSPPRT